LNNSYDVKFLKGIFKAIREGKSDAFQDEVFKLSSRMTIEKTKERMLECILSKIKGHDGNVLEADYNPL
jgi:hypothetical protein